MGVINLIFLLKYNLKYIILVYNNVIKGRRAGICKDYKYFWRW